MDVLHEKETRGSSDWFVVIVRKLIKSGDSLDPPLVEAESHDGEGKKQLEIEGTDNCKFRADMLQGELLSMLFGEPTYALLLPLRG
ncbi:hypothetical protein OPV22_032460 [Ensete ventricosum]|uniref:Uncharacterized protein n=1 Tax=Ensete ventricosum TaxID=4639 RepID=A0AAV8PKW4_ENSVE|nr:hypothetical protein OPV22_032460 [Ensete ventricosum]